MPAGGCTGRAASRAPCFIAGRAPGYASVAQQVPDGATAFLTHLGCSPVLLQVALVAPATVWVKRMDVEGARYAAVRDVDLQLTVDDFTARWLVQAKLDVDASLVTLRLVACGAHKPEASEEKEALELDDPRVTLAAAGVEDGFSLLAFVAGTGA